MIDPDDPWIRLYNGGVLHIRRPRPEQYFIINIAHGLSQVCRFGGQSERFYSVGQHSCMVCDLLPDWLKLTGLLHDAAESHGLSDVSAQAKSLLPSYKALERRHERAIAKRFGLIFPFPEAVKEADLRALAWEMKWLMQGYDYRSLPYEPPRFPFVCWTPARARREFLSRFRHLYRETA